MKKTISICICVLMLLCTVACGTSADPAYLSLPAKGHETDISLNDAMKVYCEFSLEKAEEEKIENASYTFEWKEGWEGKEVPDGTTKDGEEKLTLILNVSENNNATVTTLYLTASEADGSIRAVGGYSEGTKDGDDTARTLNSFDAEAVLERAYSCYEN